MEEITINEAFNRFKPESCVFVISVDLNGKPSGMIAGWNMKCSSEPPLYAVALSKGGYTQKLVKASREFVVAVPNKDIEEALLFFGSHHGDRCDKFAETGLNTMPAKRVRSPLIADATINLECRLKDTIDSGDHFIFIGEVLTAHLNPNKKVLLNMGKKDGERVFEEFLAEL